MSASVCVPIYLFIYFLPTDILRQDWSVNNPISLLLASSNYWPITARDLRSAWIRIAYKSTPVLGWQADSASGVMSCVLRMRADEVTRSVPECCLVNRHGSTWWRPPQSLSTAPPLRVPYSASFLIFSNGSHICSLSETGSDLWGPGRR